MTQNTPKPQTEMQHAIAGAYFITTNYAAIYRACNAHDDLVAALEEIISRNAIQNWFNLDQAKAALSKAKVQS